MTTIAWDGKSISAEGQLTCDDVIVQSDCRKVRVQGHVIFALTGALVLFDQLVDWWFAGCDPQKLPVMHGPDRGWCLVVIDLRDFPVVAHQITSEDPYADPCPAPWAWGTGRMVALGALAAGQSAEEAIRTACKFDIYSGGDIITVNVGKPLAMRPGAVTRAPYCNECKSYSCEHAAA